MRNLIIYGAGGFGKETAVLIEQINQRNKRWNLLGFYDDAKPVGEQVGAYRVLGASDQLNLSPEELDVVIAVADPHVRRQIKSKIKNPRLNFPAIIHPDVAVHSSCRVAEGSIVCANVLMTADVKIDSFVIVNLACTLGHDSHLGSFVSLMPAVNISGYVTLGEGTFVGTGATLLQQLTIGANCIVGAGALVTHSFGDGKKIVGMPARSIA